MGLSRRGLCAVSPPSALAMNAPPAFIAEQGAKMGEYFSDIIERCKCGFKGLWNNWAEVRSIGERKKKGGELSLSEAILIQRDRQDTGRLLRMIGIYAVVPSMLPYYIIFYPGGMLANHLRTCEQYSHQIYG